VLNQIEGLVITDGAVAFDDWQNSLPGARVSVLIAVNNRE
jgi:hypothetical protein